MRSCKRRAFNSATIHSHIWQTTFESSPFAQLAVDPVGCLIVANEQANTLLGLTLDNRGRPLPDLKTKREFDLYALTKQFYRDRQPVTLKQIK